MPFLQFSCLLTTFLAKGQWAQIGRTVYALPGSGECKEVSWGLMTRCPAGKAKSREGERAAVDADDSDQGRQWPVMISTFPAKVTAHHTDTTPTPWLLCPPKFHSPGKSRVHLWERLKIIVTISKLIRKQTYFDIYIHAPCLPSISTVPLLPSIAVELYSCFKSNPSTLAAVWKWSRSSLTLPRGRWEAMPGV